MSIEGLMKKKNKQGQTVLRLHYTADPDKNPTTEKGKIWFEREAKKYLEGVNDLKWRREMEIDFSAGSGELVFPWFLEKEKDLVFSPHELDDTWTFYAGLDWGTRNPTVFEVFAESPKGIIVAVWELYVERMPIKELAKNIKACPFYKKLQWIAGDPTLWSETVAKQDGFTSIAEMLQDNVITQGNVIDKLMPAHKRSDETAIVVVNQLIQDKRLFYFSECSCLINEMRNLKYPERKEYQNETEKIMDKDNHCYSDDTEILTEKGWKLFKDLEVNEKVAVWDKGYLGYEVPLRYIKKYYKGDILEYKCGGVDFCVTPNHAMWVANQTSVIRNQNPEFKRVLIENLPEVSWVTHSSLTQNSDIDISDNLIAWFGFWLAEGCKSSNYNGSFYAHIDQSRKKIDRKLLRMLWKAGQYSRYYTLNNMVRFSYGKNFYNLVADQGKSYQKFIPSWLKKASARQLRILIYWMLRGDGTNNNRMCRYNTTSKQLADDFQEICLKAGIVSSISLQPSRISVLPNGKEVIGKPVYHINIRRGKLGQGGKGNSSILSQIHASGINHRLYDGFVYCVATKSGTIYVRRNGKGMWCGQCWDAQKYMLLSHPEGFRKEEKPKYGTDQYIMEIADIARRVAGESGQNLQDVFNDMYGMNL